MNDKEQTLYDLADSLPDTYTDFARCVVGFAKHDNLIDEMIAFFHEKNPDSTVSVLQYYKTIAPK